MPPGLAERGASSVDTEVEVVTWQTASLLANSLRVDLTHGAAPSDLHMPVASDGTPLICLESLLELARSVNRLPGTGVIKGSLPGK